MNKYEAILHLPYEGMKDRKPMPLTDRAAQFAPFSALTGYEDAVIETARITEEKKELTEDAIEALNMTLRALSEPEAEGCALEVVYFQKDETKEGGAFVHKKGSLKKLLSFEGVLIFEDETQVPFENIIHIHADSFKEGAYDL